MKTLSILVILILCLVITGSADVTVKEKISTSGMMGMGGETTNMTYIKDGKIRIDMTMTGAMTGQKHPMRMNIIIRPDKGVTWYVDEAGSTYFESKVSKETKESGEAEVNVKDLKLTRTDQERTVAGYKCKGVKVDLVVEIAEEKEKTTLKNTGMLWVAKLDKMTKEIKLAWDKALEINAANTSGNMKPVMEEIASASKELEGIPLAMEMTLEMPGFEGVEKGEMEEAMKMMREFAKKRGMKEETGDVGLGKMTITREVVAISTDKLDDSLFEIPRGYRQTKTMPVPMGQ